MWSIGIIGNGPTHLIPDLSVYQSKVDIWIGADRGALLIINENLTLHHAVGDFDSVDQQELQIIKNGAIHFEQFAIEKDETDLELALRTAFSIHPTTIYLFGVTGKRFDHTLINVQLLKQVVQLGIQGIIVDNFNKMELFTPGTYQVDHDNHYPTISFIPITREVNGLSLRGFYYPLTNATIKMGSTLSISNKLIGNNGTFSLENGIVLVVRSRD